MEGSKAISQKARELIAEAGRGDRAAFSELYDLYADALFGVVARIMQSDDAGADVLHDAFVKIWKNIRKYDPTKGSPFTWMLNITRNTAIDQLRKLQNSGVVKNQDTLSSVSMNVAHRNTEREVNHIGVEDLLMNLPQEQQVIMRYVYFNGYTQSEVAEELDIPLGTVKTRTRAALITLRKYFNLLLFWI